MIERGERDNRREKGEKEGEGKLIDQFCWIFLNHLKSNPNQAFSEIPVIYWHTVREGGTDWHTK